jgi:replicative superfamily II helicase
MVDFKKRVAKKDAKALVNPIEIYETLDRASDKGPLRPAQQAILKEWYEQYRDVRDTIVKLHTGQGKTLIGLLILQSKLNENGGSALYLCPNNFLIQQTCKQAKQFGVRYCTAEDELPFEFTEGKAILITSVQKLFTGMTKFKLGNQSVPVSAVLMDDAHACIDAIRGSLIMSIPSDTTAYGELRDLFSTSLESQGMGTYTDIRGGSQDALMLVPYWDWRDRHGEVVNIISRHKDHSSIRFAWPLLKDILSDCQCIISGKGLEIAPYLPPLQLFGSYYNARHRVFMSATVTDDSFLVKGLGLSPQTIQNPLTYKEERWSGEKMILIPSMMDEALDRSSIVSTFAKPKERRNFGVVALVPGFKWTGDWKAFGSIVATKETIYTEVENLIAGERSKTLVVANRYDGIDLPDSSCRILILDSKPFAENLVDRYAEYCRTTSDVTAIRTARTIEQGLGRSVRGEKDYCVIIITGPELVKFIRAKGSRKHLSTQTNTQIEIGFEVAEMAQEDLEKGRKPLSALIGLVNQSLRRDEGWKEFYVERMEKVSPSITGGGILNLFQQELEAERKFSDGDADGAIRILQSLIDKEVFSEAEKGWYLQEIARYYYPGSKEESNKIQVAAHKKNRFLLKPRTGMQVSKIKVVSQKRIESIISWVKQFENYQELAVAVADILEAVSFGVKADRFEEGFNNLAVALGFQGQRPDKEWKEGPDNLWGLRDEEFMLVECKSEVSLTRSEINKYETEQMNSSCAWFGRYYVGAKVTNIMIIPTNRLADAAALTHDVQVIDNIGLNKLKDNVREFFAEFKGFDFKDLSEKKVQQLIDTHNLSVEAITKDYAKSIRSWK